MFTVRTNGLDFSRPNAIVDSDAAFAMVEAIEAQCRVTGLDLPVIHIVEEDGTVFWSNEFALAHTGGDK